MFLRKPSEALPPRNPETETESVPVLVLDEFGDFQIACLSFENFMWFSNEDEEIPVTEWCSLPSIPWDHPSRKS